MTWSRRTGTGTAGSAETSTVPAATVSLQPASGRRMVVVVAVCLVILMSLSDVVERADGFVVKPASSSSSASFQRRLNDSTKPSWTGQ